MNKSELIKYDCKNVKLTTVNECEYSGMFLLQGQCFSIRSKTKNYLLPISIIKSIELC